MMYNVANFLLIVQLSLSRFTLINSAQSSHVCLNYISTAQFYQSDVSITRVIIRKEICSCHAHVQISASRNFFGGFSADRNSAANPATAEESSTCVVDKVINLARTELRQRRQSSPHKSRPVSREISPVSIIHRRAPALPWQRRRCVTSP